MVIRNGFDRAMSAIVDSNITTIISGIALYLFATDQVKGFAVTLILGILTSMYTAIFCSRLMFEICERQGWIKKLTMFKLLATPNFDFLGVRWIAIGASLIVIGIGMAAVYARGWSLLDIDFTGGSSVTFALEPRRQDDDRRSPRRARRYRRWAKRIWSSSSAARSGTRFSVDTSDQSVDEVKQIILDTFDDKLQMFSVEIGAAHAVQRRHFHRHPRRRSPSTKAPDSRPTTASVTMRSSNWSTVRSNRKDSPASSWPPTVPTIVPAAVRGSRHWNVRLGGADEATAQRVFTRLENDVEKMAMFPLASKIGGRVSSNMQLDALKALFLSLLGVVVYLWVRFTKLMYGIAAAVALVHDVLVTVGMLAISKYIVEAVPGAGIGAANRFVPDQSHDRRRAVDDHRLFDQRHDRHLRPAPRDQRQEPPAQRHHGQRQRQPVLEPDDTHRAHRVHDRRDPVSSLAATAFTASRSRS